MKPAIILLLAVLASCGTLAAAEPNEWHLFFRQEFSHQSGSIEGVQPLAFDTSSSGEGFAIGIGATWYGKPPLPSRTTLRATEVLEKLLVLEQSRRDEDQIRTIAKNESTDALGSTGPSTTTVNIGGEEKEPDKPAPHPILGEKPEGVPDFLWWLLGLFVVLGIEGVRRIRAAIRLADEEPKPTVANDRDDRPAPD